ncbi:MAG: hypothetical protein AB1603_01645 [Chloroflexota bacterium]
MESFVILVHVLAGRRALQNDLYGVILLDLGAKAAEGDHWFCHVTDSRHKRHIEIFPE